MLGAAWQGLLPGRYGRTALTQGRVVSLSDGAVDSAMAARQKTSS